MVQNITLLGLLAIAIGAIPGAITRYYLTWWCKSAIGNNFPYGTFIINITGCLLMGFLFTLFAGIPGFPKEVDLMTRTGFLGSYTTFSTYGFDTLMLSRSGNPARTSFYWAGSVIFGVIGIQLGILLAHLIVK